MPEWLVFLLLNLIKTITHVYQFITWPIYALAKRDDTNSSEEMEGMGRIRALPTKEGDPASSWRCIEAMGGLATTMFPGCEVLSDLWDRAAKLWPNKDCLGTREVLKTEMERQPNGREFKKQVMGKYYWESYADLTKRIIKVGQGLYALGAKKGDRVVIFAETRSEWMITAQACFRYGLSIVTLYATLGDDAVVHGVNEAEVAFLITSDELLPKVVKILSRTPKVRHVIYMDHGIFKYQDASHNDSDMRQTIASLKTPDDISLHSVTEVEELGEKNVLDPVKTGLKPGPDDLAVIMYTSGSTGMPKGVEMSHQNLMCSLAGLSARLPLFSSRDTGVAYLPLAHVLELCSELVCIAIGIRLGYSNPQTLTDTSSRIKARSRGDVNVLRPTLMACVPTILDRIAKAVWEKMSGGGSLSTELFRWAYEYKAHRLNQGYRSPILDKLVFRKVRKLLGGKVRTMLSGGAPLGEDAQKFFNVCFCSILQGYGLTETCASGTLMSVGDLRPNHVGAPISNLEIRLRAWEEGNYAPSDKPRPRGEVLIGSNCVTQGYFKQPEKTDEEYFVDDNGQRWFCTGDIGLIHADGTLSIIDRKKDLVKLQAGEYVSLGKVELALSACPLVDTICIYGDSFQSNVVALCVPKKKGLVQLAETVGVTEKDIEKLCLMEKIRSAFLKELKSVAAEKRIQNFEVPTKVHLTPEAWTPDTGLVTDALKLKRKAIQERFQRAIDEMYGRARTVSASSVVRENVRKESLA